MRPTHRYDGYHPAIRRTGVATRRIAAFKGCTDRSKLERLFTTQRLRHPRPVKGRRELVLYSDAPIAGTGFDALARLPVANRLIELVTVAPDLPLVIALVGPAGDGKSSVLQMAGELCATRGDLRAFALDAWAAGDAAKINEAFLREVSQIFEEERVVGRVDKARDRLIELGDYVSAVVRITGVTVDVKGALEKSPDKLREEVLKLTEAIGKRIVVFVDHLDRLPPTEAIAVLKLIARWGAFPYFAFVIAFDRDQMVRNLRRIDGDADDLDRIIAVELPMPQVDRAELAGWVRGALADLAAALALDPAAALALFDVETGVGLRFVTTLRQGKRLLNALGAALPLAPGPIDLRAACLMELVRQFTPDAYPIVIDRLPLATDDAGRARLAAELASCAVKHRRPEAAAELFAALTS